MSTEFKVGDIVESEYEGKGTVVSITNENERYPIKVEFLNGGKDIFAVTGTYCLQMKFPKLDIKLVGDNKS